MSGGKWTWPRLRAELVELSKRVIPVGKLLQIDVRTLRTLKPGELNKFRNKSDLLHAGTKHC